MVIPTGPSFVMQLYSTVQYSTVETPGAMDGSFTSDAPGRTCVEFDSDYCTAGRASTVTQPMLGESPIRIPCCVSRQHKLPAGVDERHHNLADAWDE